MVDRELIQSLLLQLHERIDLLKKTSIPSFAHFQKDMLLQNAVLHLLQTSIEICLDIANHFIADEGWRSPTTNRDAFQVLFEKNIIDTTLVQRCRQMAGFRNLVVHMYEKIELAEVYAVFSHHLDDFTAFAGAIKTHLNHKNSNACKN